MENDTYKADGTLKTWHAQDVARARRGTRDQWDARCRNSMPPKTPTPKT
jgi:hypothetical protein